MIRAIRSEWIKASTVLSTKILWLIGLAFPIVVVVLTAALSDTSVLNTEDLVTLTSGLSVVTALMLGVIATVGTTADYSHSTIRPTFAAQPRRLVPLAAKTIVHVVFSAISITIVIAVCWFAGSTIVGDDGTFPFRTFNGFELPSLAAFAGLGGLTIGTTILGVGLGLLFRNIAAALAVLLLWPLLVENLVAGLLYALDVDDGLKYLPFSNGIAASFWDVTGDDELGRLPGALYFLAVSVVVLIAGLWRSTKSDA